MNWDLAMDMAKRQKEPKEKLKNYWCVNCENYRTHEMITDELGVCKSCKQGNYAPMGDID
jgi:hypothetical protein